MAIFDMRGKQQIPGYVSFLDKPKCIITQAPTTLAKRQIVWATMTPVPPNWSYFGSLVIHNLLVLSREWIGLGEWGDYYQ